jgi:S-DNA-T family DNA segregation ATPase FtsK/SpoIIIE
MVRATQSAKSAARLSAQLVRSLRESALLVFGALAGILWVALFTYDAADPGFTQASGSGEVNNAIGRVGALIADLLFNFFGRPAYLFTLMILYLGWMIYREQKTQQELTRMDYVLRIGGFFATLITSCALASLHFSPIGFRETAGGIIGQLVGGGMESVMKLLGASTILFFLWIASISVFLGISWFGVMDRIGRWCLNGWEAGRAKVVELRDKAEGRRKYAARQDTVEAEKKRAAGRSPPRIEPSLPTLEKSARAERERQVPLFEPPEAGELPPLSLLDDPPDQKGGYSEEALEAMSRLVELKLLDFGIEVEVVSVSPGPIITRFELDPAPGVKVSQISNLSKDLARSLSVESVRVV